jgi:dTDP-glucose 4,6-dehydratase
MKNILITGGAGFIGSNFIRSILSVEPNIQIINLDLLTYAGSLYNLRDLPHIERYQFVQGDICDQELVRKIFQSHQIDSVVHFAAETHVDRSIHDPQQFIRTNIFGTYNLLECAKEYWLNDQDRQKKDCRFHHISTDEVYGALESDENPFTENSPYSPNSPYAASKAASDHLVRSYGHTYGLPYVITNCSNNYGPNQYPEKFIPLMISNALDGAKLPIYGDGRQIRDWIYVEDHCEAIHTVLHKGKLGQSYNIGGNNQPTNLEVVNTLCEILDEFVPNSKFKPHHQLIEFVTDRPGHDRRYAMDSSKIASELHWRPRFSLEVGLRNTVSWYIEHQEWALKIKSSANKVQEQGKG